MCLFNTFPDTFLTKERTLVINSIEFLQSFIFIVCIFFSDLQLQASEDGTYMGRKDFPLITLLCLKSEAIKIKVTHR